jgi:hypothetical protein
MNKNEKNVLNDIHIKYFNIKEKEEGRAERR